MVDQRLNSNPNREMKSARKTHFDQSHRKKASPFYKKNYYLIFVQNLLSVFFCFSIGFPWLLLFFFSPIKLWRLLHKETVIALNRTVAKLGFQEADSFTLFIKILYFLFIKIYSIAFYIFLCFFPMVSCSFF